MKKDIPLPVIIIAVAVLAAGAWFLFSSATGPVRSESPSPDVTKMSNEEIERIRQGSMPDNVH